MKKSKIFILCATIIAVTLILSACVSNKDVAGTYSGEYWNNKGDRISCTVVLEEDGAYDYVWKRNDLVEDAYQGEYGIGMYGFAVEIRLYPKWDQSKKLFNPFEYKDGKLINGSLELEKVQ